MGMQSYRELVKATGATTPRSSADYFADFINVINYGAKGDGVTDDAAALNRASTAAKTTGKKLVVVKGDYLLGSKWSFGSLTNDIEVVCETGVRIIAKAGFPADNDLVQFTGAAGKSVIWRGGYFDATNIPNSGVGESNDTLSFNLSGARQLIIEDVELYAGDDFLTGGSDSAIFAGWAERMVFKNIRATGYPDSAMYISGGSLNDGSTEITKELMLDSVSSHSCHAGFIVKRRFKRAQIGRVYGDDTVNLLVLGGEASMTDASILLEAHEISVDSVIGVRCENVLNLRYCDNVTVGSVIARDNGIKYATGDTYETALASAVLLQGAQRCNVGRVVVDGKNSAISSFTAQALRVENRTINSVLRNSTDNRIGPIIANSIDKMVVEDDASQSRNIYDVSHAIGVGAGSTILGSGSYVVGAYRAIDVVTSLGLSSGLQLCLDAADGNSYTSGQSWLDRSGGGYDFFLGTTNSVQSTDPVFNGVADGRSGSEFFSFDGTQLFTYDSANETWMTALHQDSAAFTILGFIYPGSTGSQAIAGTTTSATAAGIQFSSGSTGQLSIVVNNGSGAGLNVASGATGDIAPTEWNFFGVSLNEATGANGVALYIRNKITLGTSTYTSPSAGAAANTMQIGARGASGAPLKSGSRLGLICIWNRALTANEVAAFKQAMRRRFGV